MGRTQSMFIHDQNIIEIDNTLRLRKLTLSDYKYAMIWYSTDNILKYSESRTKPYDIEDIKRMYSYLSGIGELYVIEAYKHTWSPIGDVTLSTQCMPMVIIPEYQGKGIGYRVIMTLLNRAKLQGIKHIKLSGIYTFNEKSFNLYSKCGFIETNRDENKIYMEIKL